MADLKPGWKRVKFGDMVTSAGATRKARGWTAKDAGVDRYVGLEHLDSNSLKIRRWGSPEAVGDNSDLRHFEPGDVLLARRGIELRKVGQADFPGVASGHALVFRARPEVVLPKFLGFFMQSDAFMHRADRFSVGSLSHTVNLSALTKEVFALPPLQEQARIADGLCAHCELIERHAEVAAACLATRRALSKQFFITAPEGKRCTVGGVADVRNGTTPRRNVDTYWGGNIPWLSTGKVNERRINHADEFITEKALQECSLGGILPVGTTLVAMIGEGITRGKVARLELPACISQNFAAVIPHPNVESWYLFYYLEAHYEFLRRWSHGTNQQALNCSLVRSFPITVPQSLTRQREIVVPLREIDDRTVIAAVRLAAVQQQFRLFSEAALSGDLS